MELFKTPDCRHWLSDLSQGRQENKMAGINLLNRVRYLKICFTCSFKDMRFHGVRALSNRGKNGLVQVNTQRCSYPMEHPSLARCTQSNRNGSSPASYSSSGDDYSVLSWKSPHFINYRALWLIDQTNFYYFSALFLILPLFTICHFSFMALLAGVCVCVSSLLVLVRSLWRRFHSQSSIRRP